MILCCRSCESGISSSDKTDDERGVGKRIAKCMIGCSDRVTKQISRPRQNCPHKLSRREARAGARCHKPPAYGVHVKLLDMAPVLGLTSCLSSPSHDFFRFALEREFPSRFSTQASRPGRGHAQTSYGDFYRPCNRVDVSFSTPNATFVEIATRPPLAVPVPE